MSKHLLEVKNLTVDFHTEEGLTRAVDNISFTIDEGETVGLVGESGSGKSVSSLAIMGLIPNPPGKITNGEILFEGQNIVGASEEKMRQLRGNDISMIFQEPMTALNPVFKVGYQISEALILHQGLTKAQAWTRSIELMNQVGIPNPKTRAHAYPHELSGGQKQRVCIAMAIACSPKLLICDEPTTALDVTIQKQVLDLIFKLQTDYKMGVLFITHDLGVIGDIADDVLVLYKSKLVEHDNVKKIFTNAVHPYTKGLLSCRPGVKHNPKRLLTVSDYVDKDGKEKKIPADALEPFEKSFNFPEDKHPNLLEVKNLKVYYPIKAGFFRKTIGHVKAVDDVSMTIKRGTTYGLVGESGCGKTTLGRSILRLVNATEGSIHYDGKDILDLNTNEMREMRSKMQIIFQDPYSSLNPRMTIEQILLEPMQIHGVGVNKKERLEIAKSLIDRVDLEQNHLMRYPHQFSGGQRQRIAIARSLALNPEFIVCDESVSALDVSVQAQVLNLLQDLQDERNLTYIFISHDLSVVNYISDYVGVMFQGKIVEYGTAKEIYKHPQMAYTKNLLSAIPKGIPKSL